MRICTNVIGLGLSFALLAPALAGPYPERPITMVIPYAAGPSSDVGVRTWLPYMSECLGGVTITPINMPGSGGQIGWAHIAQQPADGYTLGLYLLPNLSTAVVTNPDLPYDLDSFEFLSNYYANSPTISVPADSPYVDIDEIFERARSEPVNIGIASIGNEDTFLLSKLMKADPELKFQIVPLGSGPQVLAALIGGHVEVGVYSVSNVRQADNQVRPLVVATAERVKELPDVPTLREKGFDIVETTAHLVGGPAGMPGEATTKLKACFEEIGKNADFIRDAESRGMMLDVMNAEETTRFLHEKTEQLRQLWAEDPWIQ